MDTVLLGKRFGQRSGVRLWVRLKAGAERDLGDSHGWNGSAFATELIEKCPSVDQLTAFYRREAELDELQLLFGRGHHPLRIAYPNGDHLALYQALVVLES